MPTYIWMSKKQKRKVHIEGQGGKTLCKAENTGPKTAARLDTRGGIPPKDRRICSICQDMHGGPDAPLIEPEKPEQPKRIRQVPAQGSFEFLAWARSKMFLMSWQWRELRYRVLKEQGQKCGCCGAHPGMGAVMMVDHIKPRSKYPELALERANLQVLCSACNQGKGAWDETDWREPMLEVALSPEQREHMKSIVN